MMSALRLESWVRPAGLTSPVQPARDDAIPTAASTVAGHTDRIAALDGLRGMLAMMVVISHYFGEVAHGISALMFGWIAVKMFFVLSGFLMARIILDNIESPTFARTFYIRRACRTLPVYLVLLAIVFTSAWLLRDMHWMEADRIFPLWSYLTFTQGFIMVARDAFGSEWLIPTWTLTVEEQFYLVAPLICLLTPRRHLIKVLAAGALLSIGFRFLAYGTGTLPPMAALVLLPGAMHSMFFGMIGAILLTSARIDWSRYDLLLRAGPVAILMLAMALKSVDGQSGMLFNVVSVPLVSLACVMFLMAIVRGAPEAERMKTPRMRVLGRLSYSLYLLHMPVLGLMHGLILGARPDIATPVQIVVTVLAIPAALALVWVVNRLIEQPMIAYGRTWKFAKTSG